MKELITMLNQLGTELEYNFYALNAGGCCVVAAALAEELSKIVPCQVRVSGLAQVESIDEARPNVRRNTADEWDNRGIDVGHVFVQATIDGVNYFVDSNGVKRYSDRDPTCHMPVIEGCLTLQEAIEMADSREGWNRAFNRQQIPAIRGLISTFFNAKILPQYQEMVTA